MGKSVEQPAAELLLVASIDNKIDEVDIKTIYAYIDKTIIKVIIVTNADCHAPICKEKYT